MENTAAHLIFVAKLRDRQDQCFDMLQRNLPSNLLLHPKVSNSTKQHHQLGNLDLSLGRSGIQIMVLNGVGGAQL